MASISSNLDKAFPNNMNHGKPLISVLLLNKPLILRQIRPMATILTEKSAGNQSETVKAVRKWLDDNDGWLLILDNADDLLVVREFIPVGGKVTSC
jgi:hypothetical protein